jgi:hypothetical protein
MLLCDAPGCVKQTPAALVRGVITAPKPWWILGLVCACKTEHILQATASGVGKQSTKEAEHDQ